MTDFAAWDRKARSLLAEDESDEERERNASNAQLGLDGAARGPPVAAARAQLNELERQTQEKKEIMSKVNAMEETYAGISKNAFVDGAAPLAASYQSTFTEGDANGGMAVVDGNGRAIRLTDVRDSQIKVKGKTVKLMLERCANCVVDVTETVVTSTCEIWSSQNCALYVRVPLQTIQVDKSSMVAVDFDDGMLGNFVVQHACERLQLKVAGTPLPSAPGSEAASDPALQYVSTIARRPGTDGYEVSTAVVQRHAEKEFPTFLPGGAGAAPPAPASGHAEAAAKKQAGNDAFKANDFMQAIALYSLSLAAREDPVVLGNRAQCWLKTGAFDKAVEDCDAGLALNAELPKLHFRRGIALQALAQKELDRENDRKVNRNEIRYSEVQKQLQQALESFGRAERLDAKNKQIKDAINFAQMKLNKAMQLGFKKD